MYIIIPARYNSTRLPGKLVQDIAGKSVLQRTFEQCILAANRSDIIKDVILTADCKELVDHIATWTDKRPIYMGEYKNIRNGTEACYIAAKEMGLPNSEPIINVQGDNYEVGAEAVLEMAKLLSNAYGSMKATTLFSMCENFADEKERNDTSVVKVFVDIHDKAFFFTRNGYDSPHVFKHCGIYGYFVAFLNQYMSLNVSLERMESLEQMRVLENGLNIYCPHLPEGMSAGHSINTEADLTRARKELNNDD